MPFNTPFPLPSDWLPLRTRRGFPYYELINGYQESFSHPEQKLTRVCRVKREVFDEWANDMIGSVGFVKVRRPALARSDSWATILSRSPPDKRAGSRDSQGLYCTQLDWLFGLEPFHPANSFQQLDWREYVYAAQYSSLPYDVLPDNDPQIRTLRNDPTAAPELLRYVERTAQQTVEAMTVPGGIYYLVGSGPPAIPINQPPPKALTVLELTYTWHHVPAEAIPTPAIRACAGKVNDAVFDRNIIRERWAFKSFQPGTLLMTGVDYKFYLDFWRVPVVDILYKFTWRDNGRAADGNRAGWNYLYHHGSGLWRLATHDGTATGRTIYEEENFDKLFQASA